MLHIKLQGQVPSAAYQATGPLIKSPMLHIKPQGHWSSPKCCISNHRATGQVPSAAYQATGPLALWFQRRRFLKVFTIYGHGGYLGHVTQMPCTNFHSPYPVRLHMKFGLGWLSGFLRRRHLKCVDVGPTWMDDGTWLYYKLI